MTATESNKKISFFATRLKNNIKANRKQLIINIVLNVFGLPAITIIGIISEYIASVEEKIGYKNFSDKMLNFVDIFQSAVAPFITLSFITLSVSILMGMVIALMHFSYLYRKTQTDMNYSLPLTGTQRFFADYLSGLIIYMVPLICSVIFFFATIRISAFFIDTLNDVIAYFPDFLILSALVLTGMLLYYTLSVLSITFCGNTFEAIFSIISFNGLIPSTLSCVWFALCSSTSFGIDTEGILYKNIFTSTSPIGAVVFMFSRFDLDSSSKFTNNEFFKWLFITFIVIGIYLIVAYFIYRFRKSEDVSKPYVHKAAFYAIMTMAVYCILSLFVSFKAFIIVGIILCAIGWFIMEVITRRGFKKFWQAGISFTLSVVSVLAICEICEVTNGFGMAKHVPSPFVVESVTINGISYKNKDVIKQTIDLHKEIIDRHFNSENYDYIPVKQSNAGIMTYDDYFDITYKTFTGSTIMREYRIPKGMMGELTKTTFLTDEYAEYSSNELYNNNKTYVPESQKYSSSISIVVCNKFGYNETMNLTNEELKKLSDAYHDDLCDMTIDDLEKFDNYFYISYGRKFFVLSSFTKTLDFLNEKNINFKEITDDDITNWEIQGIQDPIFIDQSRSLLEENSDTFGYYDYDDSYFISDSICTIDSCNLYLDNNLYSLCRHSHELVKVLNNCSTDIIEGLPIAVFNIIDNTDMTETMLFLPDTSENQQLLDDLNDVLNVPLVKGEESFDFS